MFVCASSGSVFVVWQKRGSCVRTHTYSCHRFFLALRCVVCIHTLCPFFTHRAKSLLMALMYVCGLKCVCVCWSVSQDYSPPPPHSVFLPKLPNLYIIIWQINQNVYPSLFFFRPKPTSAAAQVKPTPTTPTRPGSAATGAKTEGVRQPSFVSGETCSLSSFIIPGVIVISFALCSSAPLRRIHLLS